MDCKRCNKNSRGHSMVQWFVDQEYYSKKDIWPFQVEPTMGYEVEVGVGRRVQTEAIPWTMGRGGSTALWNMTVFGKKIETPGMPRKLRISSGAMGKWIAPPGVLGALRDLSARPTHCFKKLRDIKLSLVLKTCELQPWCCSAPVGQFFRRFASCQETCNR